MPLVLLPPQLTRFSEGWRLANPSRGGPVSITGSQQNVVSGASYWEASLSFTCRKPADFREVNGFLAALDGVANPFLVGPADWRGQPWNVNYMTGEDITPDKGRINQRNNPEFEANPALTSQISFILHSGARMNATSITVRRIRGGFIKRGQYFSIGNRLHVITDVTSADPTDSRGLPAAGPVTVNIRPWLRLDYSAGTVLEFARPVTQMQLTKDAAPMVERTISPQAELLLGIKEYF